VIAAVASISNAATIFLTTKRYEQQRDKAGPTTTNRKQWQQQGLLVTIHGGVFTQVGVIFFEVSSFITFFVYLTSYILHLTNRKNVPYLFIFRFCYHCNYCIAANFYFDFLKECVTCCSMPSCKMLIIIFPWFWVFFYTYIEISAITFPSRTFLLITQQIWIITHNNS